MEFCNIDPIPNISKGSRQYHDWEFSDEEQGSTRTRFVPKAKSKRGSRRTGARQVEVELDDSYLTASKRERHSFLRLSEDWSKPLEGNSNDSSNKKLDGLPEWSDSSAEEEEITQNRKPIDDGVVQRLLDRLHAINAAAARDKTVQSTQASMEGGMSVDVGSQGGDSHAAGVPVKSEFVSQASPGRPTEPTLPSANTPTKVGVSQRKLKSKPPRCRKLSQAYHPPRKRAKFPPKDIRRGFNLIKTADQLRRLAGIGRASTPIPCPSQMSIKEEGVDAIVSNTDEEENTEQLRETIEMSAPTLQNQTISKPTISYSTRAPSERRKSLPTGQQASQRTPQSNGQWRKKKHASHWGCVAEREETDYEGRGLFAQRSFLAKLKTEKEGEGGWRKQEASVRVSKGRKKQGDLAARLQEITAVDKARKERFNEICDSERSGIRHIDLIALKASWEGHLVTAVCDVVTLPSDGVCELPPKLTAFVNSKGGGGGIDISPGVKLRVYEPWTSVELGQNQGMGLLCNLVSIVE